MEYLQHWQHFIFRKNRTCQTNFMSTIKTNKFCFTSLNDIKGLLCISQFMLVYVGGHGNFCRIVWVARWKKLISDHLTLMDSFFPLTNGLQIRKKPSRWSSIEIPRDTSGDSLISLYFTLFHPRIVYHGKTDVCLFVRVFCLHNIKKNCIILYFFRKISHNFLPIDQEKNKSTMKHLFLFQTLN